MKVIRGVNVFPTPVEAALLSLGEEVAPHYMMIVDRVNNSDVLTVMVEVNEKFLLLNWEKSLERGTGALLKVRDVFSLTLKKQATMRSTGTRNELFQQPEGG